MPRAKPSSAASRPKGNVILVACTGLSPAVLTETVWALAHQSPQIIPDRVVAITTITGQRKIAELLFGHDEIWNQLRSSILGRSADRDARLDFDATPDRVKVVHRREGGRRIPIDELATHSDHTAFADALADELWIHTSKPDTRVIASLAGGFKTMSALMLTAMQLLANTGDRVTHVLCSGGYDATHPLFFFPGQEQQELTSARTETKLKASSASGHIHLIDVPFIPLRRWFEEALSIKPPSYDVLLKSSIRALDSHFDDLNLEIGPVVLATSSTKHWIRINGVEHKLSSDRYVYLRFFGECVRNGRKPFTKLVDIVEEIEDWLNKQRAHEPRLHAMYESFSGENSREKEFDPDSIPKRMNSLRKFLTGLQGGRALAAVLPAKGRWMLQLAPEKVTLH